MDAPENTPANKAKKVKCPTCGGTRVVKFGRTKVGAQRYSCRDKECTTDTFQAEYTYVGSEKNILSNSSNRTKIYNVRPLEA